jgi:hypothetical protein
MKLKKIAGEMLKIREKTAMCYWLQHIALHRIGMTV